ncbi:12772_t:CDS:2 [Acaulospora colombiana]|uniref:12772_t:CDS:1 n=1 Tax=Acaulospora colombiana TaxID=27376 RepID=A0ACA9KBN2_9GLOM|nr:12772_t:CDS:2 [Acaulospora colombiana]
MTSMETSVQSGLIPSVTNEHEETSVTAQQEAIIKETISKEETVVEKHITTIYAEKTKKRYSQQQFLSLPDEGIEIYLNF